MTAAEWKTIQEQVLKNREEHKQNNQVAIDRELEKQWQDEYFIRMVYGIEGHVIDEDNVDENGYRIVKMKKVDDIIFGLIPTSMKAKPSDAKRAACLLKENRLPEQTLNVVKASVFQKAGIPVRTVKGDLIPDCADNVYVLVDNAANQAYAKAYYEWALQDKKEVKTSEGLRIPSLRILDVETPEEFYRIQADQSSIERCRNYKERVRLAGELSADEVIRKANSLAQLNGVPFEEIFWAVSGGKKLTCKELKAAMDGGKINWEPAASEIALGEELTALLYGKDSKVSNRMLRRPALRKTVQTLVKKKECDMQGAIRLIREAISNPEYLDKLNNAQNSNEICLLFGKLSTPSL